MTTHLDVALLPSSSGRGTMRAFALMWSLVVLARTFLHTLVPLQAYALLGDAKSVSLLYFAASLIGMVGSLAVPWLVRHLRRRHVFTLAGLGLMAATGLLAMETVPGLTAGLILQVVTVDALDITLNLYVMDHLRRRQYAQYEPMRAFYSALFFVVGPVTGVWLAHRVAPWLPYLLSAATAACLLAVFWMLRWTEHPAVQPMRRRPPNPLLYLPRFFAQPRLRLAYLLATARSGWWAIFFIYAPIYVVRLGYDEVVAGALVSAALGSLFLARLWGMLAAACGVRRFLIACYSVGGLATLAVAAVGDRPVLGIATLLFAALAVGALDGVGNVYFLRAVRPLERPEMTTVFTTYRDAGQTVPPGVLAALLRVFPFPVVFLAGGLWLLVVAWYARYIPRRM